LVVLAAVVLQISIVTNIRIDGMHPEIIWLFPVCAGLVAGSQVGAVTGFASGLALDCLQPTPFGLTALVATILGFLVGLLAERNGLNVEGAAWWVIPVLGAGTTAVAVGLYGLLGFVFGEDQFTSINYLVLIPVVTVAAGILAIPAWLAVHWAMGEHRGKRRIHSEVASW
jgi:rod shape-determining protein MreD